MLILVYYGGFPFKGGKLIILAPGVEATLTPVVKEHLDVKKDRKIIIDCELTSMWDDKDLSERLIHFFETGKDCI